MNKNTINLVNPHAIEEYLNKFCADDQRLAFLLNTTLTKIIKKTPECMSKLSALPENAPLWLSRKWNACAEWHSFSPNNNIFLPNRIIETINWLKLAMEHDVEWLKRTDDRGRPLKLLNISDFSQIVPAHWNDYRKIVSEERRTARKMLKDEEENIAFQAIMEFKDGYKIVRLLTEEALDRESAFMEHCIGDGDYDEHLKDKKLFYYSLRTIENEPCVTVSIDTHKKLIDFMAGHRDSFPDEKYLGYIASLCDMLKVDMTEYIKKPSDEYKILNDEEQEFQNIPDDSPPDLTFNDMKEPITLEDDMHLNGLYISNIGCLESFPKNLQIDGDVYLYGSHFPKNPPEGLTVGGCILTGLETFKTVTDFLNRYYPGQRVLH